MEKETIVPQTPPSHQAQVQPEPAVRAVSMDETRKLIRKVSKEHAELFRRLAQ